MTIDTANVKSSKNPFVHSMPIESLIGRDMWDTLIGDIAGRVALINRFRSEGYSTREIADRFEVSFSTISQTPNRYKQAMERDEVTGEDDELPRRQHPNGAGAPFKKLTTARKSEIVDSYIASGEFSNDTEVAEALGVSLSTVQRHKSKDSIHTRAGKLRRSETTQIQDVQQQLDELLQRVDALLATNPGYAVLIGHVTNTPIGVLGCAFKPRKLF